MQARHQLKQYEGRIKNIEEEHKQVMVEDSLKRRKCDRIKGTDLTRLRKLRMSSFQDSH